MKRAHVAGGDRDSASGAGLDEAVPGLARRSRGAALAVVALAGSVSAWALARPIPVAASCSGDCPAIASAVPGFVRIDGAPVQVVLHGSNLAGATAVYLQPGGSSVPFQVLDPTQLTVTLPVAAEDGQSWFVVDTPAGESEAQSSVTVDVAHTVDIAPPATAASAPVSLDPAPAVAVTPGPTPDVAAAPTSVTPTSSFPWSTVASFVGIGAVVTAAAAAASIAVFLRVTGFVAARRRRRALAAGAEEPTVEETEIDDRMSRI